MKKALIVYNPKSGNKSFSQNIDYVIERFQNKDIMPVFYRIGNEKYKIEDMLTKDKYDMVIFSGGDGTVNYGVNILMKLGLNIPVGIIPAGTCNDFATCIDISSDIDDSLEAILEGEIKNVDIGLINDEFYFLSTFAGGLFAGVAFDTKSDLKKNLGPFAYYIKGISEVINYKTFKLKIKTESEEFEETAVMFIIVNGKHAGGFKGLVKDAEIADGYMHIIIIKECLHVDLTMLFFKVLTSDFLNDKNIHLLKAKECEISNIPDNVSLTVDGEKWEEKNINIKFLKQRLKVFIKKENRLK